MTDSKDKLEAMNKLNDQRDLFVEGFLKKPKTLGIVVHGHKMNTKEHPNFAVSRVSVNIFHRTSMLSAMGPMTMMLMTKLFRRTHRDGQLKDRERDKYRLYHGYNKLLKELKKTADTSTLSKANVFQKQ